jgi:hypothetical protein
VGILRWHSRTDHHFAVVDASWWQEYTAYGWLDVTWYAGRVGTLLVVVSYRQEILTIIILSHE